MVNSEYIIVGAVSGLISVGLSVTLFFMNVGKYKEKIVNLEKQMPKIDRLNEKIIRFEEWKKNTQKDIDKQRGVFESKSPLALTDYGEKLLKDSGFMEVFERIKNELVHELEQRNPKNKYQVQEFARDIMDALTKDPRFESLQKYVYEHPDVDVGLILRTGGIPLRDLYLEKHPEIKN